MNPNANKPGVDWTTPGVACDGVCCEVIFCPCLSIGWTFAAVSNKAPALDRLCCFVSALGGWPIAAMLLKKAVAQKYGIDFNMLWHCLCCYCCGVEWSLCYICQAKREMNKREWNNPPARPNAIFKPDVDMKPKHMDDEPLPFVQPTASADPYAHLTFHDGGGGAGGGGGSGKKKKKKVVRGEDDAAGDPEMEEQVYAAKKRLDLEHPLASRRSKRERFEDRFQAREIPKEMVVLNPQLLHRR